LLVAAAPVVVVVVMAVVLLLLLGMLSLGDTTENGSLDLSRFFAEPLELREG